MHMELNLATVVITVINFIILYLILRHFLFDKVNGVIDERNSSIKENIDKAETDKKEAEALKSENLKKLEESKIEGKKIVENYKQKAEKVSEGIKGEASNEAELIIERAKKEVQLEKEKAEDELKNKVVDLAVILSSKALEKSINEEEHRRLIEEFIAKVGN